MVDMISDGCSDICRCQNPQKKTGLVVKDGSMLEILSMIGFYINFSQCLRKSYAVLGHPGGT